MAARIKNLKLVAIAAIILGSFSFAVAAPRTPNDNVKVRVFDANKHALPFATVTLNDTREMTSQTGTPAKLDVPVGNHTLSISHPLVTDEAGTPLVAEAKISITPKKKRANVTVTLRTVMKDDPTAPDIANMAPQASSQTIKDRPIEFRVAARDPESGIANAEAILDNRKDLGDYEIGLNNLYIWRSSGLVLGPHTISYKFWNYAGRESRLSIRFNVLEPTGAVAGKVTYRGNPVAGANVKFDDSKQSVTGEDGRYLIVGLTPGNRQISVSADGFNSQQATANIVADNSATLDFNLIDGVAPAIPANLRATNGRPSSQVQIVSWDPVTDRSGVSYEVEYGKVLDGASGKTVVAAGESQITLNELAANTLYEYRVRAKDSAEPANSGEWSQSMRLSTNNIPQLSWPFLADNDRVSGLVDLKVNYRANGNGNKINEIQWLVLPDTLLGVTRPALDAGIDSFQWNTALLANGQYAVKVIALDNEGNASSSTINLRVDNGAVINGTVVSYGAPVANASVTTDDGLSATTDSAGRYGLTRVTQGRRTITVAFNGLTSQTKEVEAGASAATVNFDLIDTVAPTIPEPLTITNVAPTSSRLKLEWTASNDLSGIDRYEILTDSGRVLVGHTDQLSFIIDNLQPDWLYYYDVRAKDKRGNYSQVTFAGRTTHRLPTASWVSPTAGQSVVGSVNLTASYTATNSNIKNVTLQVDGVTILSRDLDSASGQVEQNWDSNSVPNGTRNLRLIVTDANENSREVYQTITVNNPMIGSVKGTVTDSVSRNPLAGVILDLKKDGQTVATLLTDANGGFDFSNTNAGTYSLVAAIDGYAEKVVENIQAVKDQVTTADLALQPYGRITRFGTPETLIRFPASRGIDTFPRGLSIKDNDLAVTTDGDTREQKTSIYDANNGNFVRNIVNTTGDRIAHEKSGYFIASYGGGGFINNDGSSSGVGYTLGYTGAVSADDGSVYATTPDRVYQYIDRRPTFAFGTKISTITSDCIASPSLSKRSIYAVTYCKSGLVRFNRIDPSDKTKSTKTILPYEPAQALYIVESKTILVSERKSHRLHLHDATTLEEYDTVDIPLLKFNFHENATIVARPLNNMEFKLYFTGGTSDPLVAPNAVYTLTATKN